MSNKSNSGFKRGNTPWNKGKQEKTPAEMVAAGYNYHGKWVKASDAELKAQKKKFITAMTEAKGYVTKASELLGMKRATFYKVIARWPEIPWRDKNYWKNKKPASLKKELIQALDLNDGHKTKAATTMGCGIKEFNRMLALYPEVDWLKLYPKKNLNNHTVMGTKVFDFPQIFFVYYDHVLEWGTKKRIATVIWAKSSKEAIELVKSKVKEDNAWHTARNFKTYVGHQNFRKGKFSTTDWEVIRSSAYPNIRQEMIKTEVTR